MSTLALDRIESSFPLPSWRTLCWVLMGLLAAFVIWASLATMKQVATAPGTIVPAGQVRVIQHLEGGIVVDIAVSDGDTVAAGQPLIRLDLGGRGLSREEAQARVDGLLLQRARLTAEASGIALSLPEAPASRQPDLARAETEAFENRLRQMRSNLEVLGERKTQRALDLEIIDTQLDGLRRQMDLSTEQHNITSQLARDELFPRLRSLEIQLGLEQLNTQIAELVLARPLAESALAEITELERQELIRYQTAATDELREVEVELARQQELLGRASDQTDRTAISSPIDGIVQGMQVNTIGGIVEAGQPIMQIVPVAESMVVEARLSPTDIGQVHIGQDATVRFTAYDFQAFGGLDGQIDYISADRNVDQNGEAYYLVKIRLNSQALAVDGAGVLPILPGMETQVDIHTGDRTVLDYILQPVLKLRDDAFRH